MCLGGVVGRVLDVSVGVIHRRASSSQKKRGMWNRERTLYECVLGEE